MPTATQTPPAASAAVPKYRTPQEASRIYLLPNLFTAGNMLCGFLSIYSCIQAKFVVAPTNGTAAGELYRQAVYFILGACVCDLFDGRVARTFKRESLFGAEFDSIADIISFGLAPALMICFLILSPETALKDTDNWVQNIGQKSAWVIAFIYLLCVGVRLARFNVLTNPLVPGNENKPAGGDFVGLPCPTAAGMIASVVLLFTSPMFSEYRSAAACADISAGANDPHLLTLKIVFTCCLPFALLISYLMISNIRYPSFKRINWNTKLKIRAFIGLFLFIVLTVTYYELSVPLLFLAYILYGIYYTVQKKRLAKLAAANDASAQAELVPDAEADWDENENSAKP